MAREIFRQKALEHLSSPEQLDQAIRVVSPSAWMALWASLALLIAAFIWSFTDTVPETVAGRGILISPGGVLDIVAASSGRVTQLTVKSGDWVKSGQVVAYVAQPDIEGDLAVAKAETADAQAQYQYILESQEREVALQHSVMARKRQALEDQATVVTDRLQTLGTADKSVPSFDTTMSINKAKEEAANIQSELAQLDLDDSTAAITREHERTDQEQKIASLQRQVTILTDKLRRSTEIVSPYTGTLVETKINAGELVEPGRALFSLLPQDKPTMVEDVQSGHMIMKHQPGDLMARLYVTPEDGKKISVGMPVEISPSTVKREEYGFMEGKVSWVATIPSTREGMFNVLKNKQLVDDLSGTGSPFEVWVDLATDPKSHNGFKWSSSAGPDMDVNTGTLSDGSITVRHIHLISLAIPAVEQLFDRSPS